MLPAFYIGLTGAIILVGGAAYPIRPVKHPAQSLKNWLYAIGGAIMLWYSILNYLIDGSIFFVFLQILVNLAGVLMLINVKESLSTVIISLGGIFLVGWSLRLFEDFSTLLFILGLIGISLGYISDITSTKRYIDLTIGSALVSLFSYAQGDMIFFWLNAFFAIFSAHSVFKMARK